MSDIEIILSNTRTIGQPTMISFLQREKTGHRQIGIDVDCPA